MADNESKNDILAHEWDTLKTLWEHCNSPANDAALRQELEDSLKAPLKPPEQGGWDALNRAEQIVGIYLDPVRLKFEYDNLLNLARLRKLPSVALFEEYARTLFQNPVPTGSSTGATSLLEKQQRAAYLVLLYNLQSAFVEARFERQIKRVAAQRLRKYGLVLIAITLGLHLIWNIYEESPVTDLLTLIVVGGMGSLGAFFSRVATFQTNYSTLRFADITNSYNRTMLVVRLIYGGIGAIIFYFILRSGLLNGPVLPDWAVLEGRAAAKPPLTAASEWSKVLVWSFIAGFSERFVSSSLDKIDSQ